MGRITRLTSSALAAAVMVIGLLAPAALAAGSGGVGTRQPLSDGSWTPGTNEKAEVFTMRPFSDATWTPVSDAGVRTTRPFNDVNWTPHGEGGGVRTMRPFSDPNAIKPGPAAAGVDAGGSTQQSSGIGAGALALIVFGLVAAAAILVALTGRLRRPRPV
jgi:hypothetical protein